MSTQPNILLIVTDQLAPHAVGSYGSTERRTPTIDRLAEQGVRFDKAYTACPISVPSRAAFWTSHYPHQNGVPGNGKFEIPQDMPSLGSLFHQAGYYCAHFGKTHDSGALRHFDRVESDWPEVEQTPPWTNYGDTQEDRGTTNFALDFLRQDHDKPWLLALDYNNPHDICLWVGDNAFAHEDAPVPTNLPPLPDNFETHDMDKRPIAVRLNCCAQKRVAQTFGWTPQNYRYYLAAYYHYVDMVDMEIAKVLKALRKRGDADNTIIVLLSDHGEGMAAHGMVTKGGVFFEETTRVPFIFAGKGVTQRNVNAPPLASLMDMVPTLCDLAGVAIPDSLEGRSLKPWLTGQPAEDDLEYVVSTWHGGGGVIMPGRMIRTERFKYTCFREDEGEELYDLDNDPGESRTLIDDPKFKDVLERHRALLRKHCEQTGDPFFSQKAEFKERMHEHSRDEKCPFHKAGN